MINKKKKIKKLINIFENIYDGVKLITQITMGATFVICLSAVLFAGKDSTIEEYISYFGMNINPAFSPYIKTSFIAFLVLLVLVVIVKAEIGSLCHQYFLLDIESEEENEEKQRVLKENAEKCNLKLDHQISELKEKIGEKQTIN